MNVVSENNEVFNASVSMQKIDGYSGLVMESRGGTKKSANERNTDYILALEAILSRIFKLNVKTIRVFLVSRNALKIWPSMPERALKMENSIDIKLYSNIETLRKSICKEQQNKKENLSSKGGNPTKKILICANLNAEQWKSVVLGDTKVHTISEDEIKGEAFDPKDAESAKERITQLIANRRGQAKFRKKLLQAYNEKCAISATNLSPVLEAAHIVPYQGIKTNHITNGILLRSDFHTLFDLGLIGINKSYKVIVSSSLYDTEYERYHESDIFLPTKEDERPSFMALESRALPYRQK
ncbi:restriction endonuclease [uncultured Candidatus Thioglobus sp.]|nr:restriction endonuclease [uncultured Candidatus Thioglobus sp.]